MKKTSGRAVSKSYRSRDAFGMRFRGWSEKEIDSLEYEHSKAVMECVKIK